MIHILLAVCVQDSIDVTNPTSGAKLWVQVHKPKSEKKLPAVVLVTGGLGCGSQQSPRVAEEAKARGLILVLFDPDGRGKSEGKEDYNGKVHQDALCAVFRAARKLEGVDRVGIVSLSFGIAIASGMIARYPEEPVAFYIDWEGPSDRHFIGTRIFQRGPQPPKLDEEFWRQREAFRFAPLFKCPYLRIQGESDHVHKAKYGHALQMIAAATGKAPWTRLNDNPENKVFTESDPPKLLPGRTSDLWIRYAVELFRK